MSIQGPGRDDGEPEALRLLPRRRPGGGRRVPRGPHHLLRAARGRHGYAWVSYKNVYTTFKFEIRISQIGHEEKQKRLKALRNRQDLFQEEGILNLILDAIDKMNVISSQVR